MKRASRCEPFAEINITPLTDIFLVLLVIVIIVSPAITATEGGIAPPGFKLGSDLDMHLPVVEMDVAGNLYLHGKRIPQDRLDAALAAWPVHANERTLIVRADAKCESAKVLELFQRAQRLGFQSFFVAGEPVLE